VRVAAAPFVSLAPWAVIVCLALVLGYKLAVISLVRGSKTDMLFRDRWLGLWVQRGPIRRSPDNAAIDGRTRSADEAGESGTDLAERSD
jgi:hypothetical protein